MGEQEPETIIVELLVDQSPDPELKQFLDREWAAWHASQRCDQSVDWSSSSMAFVARDASGTILGAATGRMRAGVGHLSELMVTQRFRGNGLGSELTSRFEEHCWSSGCHKVTVHTDRDSPAHGFYMQRGWQAEAIFRRDRGGRDFVRLCKFKEDNA